VNHDRNVDRFAWRLLAMFPHWNTDQAFQAAESIVTLGEAMVFEMAVEDDLAKLPMVAT
jgi:hypothetical protein